MYICRLLIFLTCTLALFTETRAQPKYVAPVADKPAPKREFRGVWIATVENIDWPSKPGLTSDQQQQELISRLNAHQQEGINAVMLQVRPAADAFYAQSR